MRRNLHIVLLALAMLFVAGLGNIARGQDYIRVEGYIYNVNRNAQETPAPGHKHPFFGGVIIYIYETEAEGQDAQRRLLQWIDKHKKGLDSGPFDPGDATYKDLTQGEMEWPYVLGTVSPEGSLLFFNVFNQDDCRLVKVRGRERIDVNFDIKSEGVSLELDAAKLSVSTKPMLKPEPPVELGDTIKLNKGYLFPMERMGKPDARFVLQSYIISAVNPKDTNFRKAVVMDGEDYHETQLRRMGYDEKRDILYQVAENSPRLTDTTSRVYWSDRIVKGPKTRSGGLIKANLWFEDYNHVYHSEVYEVEDLSRMHRPMQFLEFSVEATELDPNDEYNKRIPEKKSVPGDLQLPISFETGKAVVNLKDSMSLVYLDSLKNTVYDLTHTEGKKLLKYSIYGYASPEGGYAKNVSLARERLNYIDRQVRAEIPPKAMMGMRTPVTDSHVSTWLEFADTLAKDTTMVQYANEIREIVAKHPGENAAAMDQQFAKIRKLPYYNTIIKDNLSRMRLVNFMYTTQIWRELTTEEILNLYYHDPKYKEKARGEEFLPAEFWVLMQNVKDTLQLEKICKRAMRQDRAGMRRKKPEELWVLPANVLAVSYIKRHHPDTSVLAPYIDETQPLNRRLQMEGQKFLLNPTAVVANQVSMMLLAENYTRAVNLAYNMFRDSEDPKLQSLYAIARCKAGYFDARTEEGQKYYSMVHDTSPRNAVVMDMAIPMYRGAVRDELEDLDPEDPVTDYLRAQFECFDYYHDTGRNNFNMMDEEVQEYAIRRLVAAFRKDAKLIETAAGDWYIFKELYQKAKQEYDEPGSVLPPELDEADTAAGGAPELTDEQKRELVLKSIYHPEEMTDEDWALYDKYDLANYSLN